MGVKASIEVDAADVLRALDRLQYATTGGLRSFLEVDVTDYLVSRLVNRFAAEGDDASGDWLPLAESTREIRAQLGYGPSGPINERTEEMESFLFEGTKEVTGAAGDFTLVTPGPGMDSTLQEKITTAQRGSDKNPLPGAGPTPARPVLVINERDVAEILGLLRMYIVESMVGTR